ncbi:hypothetical protein M8J75_000107 [Diaphorina citri]|nr:hypothetical protein M8J75_000107 [Diaphorina citri]
MADFNTDTAESNSLEDLILLDNFQKEDSSHNAPPGTPSSEAYSLYSSSLVDIGKTRTHDDNVELYDIIARDNFTAEDAYTAGISDTVLANLPSEVAQGLKTDAPQKTLPTLPDATSTQSLSGVLNISETPDATHEEYTTLVTYCDETRARLKAKSELRKSNLMPARDESKLSKLDSSLKKNSAFVKKLKNFTSQQLDSLLKDLSLLNLSKYMSEVTSALVDVKLKLTDVPSALILCSELHRVYSDFAKLFFDAWSRSLTMKRDEKIVNSSKLRVDLRFYGDLISSGVFQNKEAFCLLGNVLTFLISTDKEEHNNLSIIISFCKYCGEDYAGLVPKHIQVLARKYNVEVPKSDLIPHEKQRTVKLLLVDYFQSLCRHILKENSELKNFEKQNLRILQSKGELRQERRDQFENLMASLRKLTQSAETFAELIAETLPDIPKDKCVTDETNSTGNIVSICGTESEDGGSVNFNSIWDDEEMQSFYQDIPFLKDFLPHLKLKVTSPVDGDEPWKSKGTPTSEEIISEDKIDEEINKLTQEDECTNTGPNDMEAVDIEDKEDEDKEKKEGKEKEEVKEKDDGKEKEQSPVTSEPGGGGGLGGGINVNNVVKGGGIDTFLANLYKCENREMIDNAAVEFIMYYNTRTNRKKLTSTLLFVPRTRLDLLPFLSRFVAILHPFQPDISSDLVNMLKNDFKYHTKKKDQINIESKIKNVRYIGELVKFKLYSKIEVLYCLKVLLNDFAHHHVEMCCHLLETCGRYLYRNKDTHPRIKVYLEQMIRKKTVLNLDARYNMMIENAFYYVNPPEVPVSKKKDKPVMQLFIEKIVYVDLMNCLEKDTEAKVLSYLLKLDWNDETVVKYVVRVFSQPWRVKYDLIRKLANVLAGLVEYEEGEGPGVQVVDSVTEDIRACLESRHPRHNQRRLAVLKYFGELYNYRLIESNDVFKVLYSLITFGVHTPTSNSFQGNNSSGGSNYSQGNNIPSGTGSYSSSQGNSISSQSNIPSGTGSYSSHGNNPDPSLLLDPPDNLFRIKLVCVLLETCGQYFSHGITRTKLDYFFVFFQAYFWSKYDHPVWRDKNDVTGITIRNLYREVLTALRPNIRLAKSYEEALKARDELVSKLLKLKPLGEITNTGGKGMGVIEEETEEEVGRGKENKTRKIEGRENAKGRGGLGGERGSETGKGFGGLNVNRNLVDSSKGTDSVHIKSAVISDRLDGQGKNILDQGSRPKGDSNLTERFERQDSVHSDVMDVDVKSGGVNTDGGVNNGGGVNSGDGNVNTDEMDVGGDEDDETEPITEDYEDYSGDREDLPEDNGEEGLTEDILKKEGLPEGITREGNRLAEEEDEFISEFEKMMSENLQERTRETITTKNKLANMSVPVNFLRSNLKNYEQLESPTPEDTINFVLMIRSKSNKQTYKPLVVPSTCELVTNLKSQEKAKKHEMDQVKKLTLNITDRLEEEDYHAETEGVTQGIGQVRNLNHGSYQRSAKQPKGPYTPDAELIFGKAKKPYAKYS